MNLGSASTGWNKVARASSCGLIVLGLVVLAGWHLQIPFLVQTVAGLVAMQYNSALCFLALGLAGLGLVPRRPVLLITGGGAAVLMGVAVCIEYVGGQSLGIDTAFFYPWVQALSANPGRMAVTTALSFALTGLSLVIIGIRPNAWGVFGLLNLIAPSLALTSLMGYAFGITYVLPFRLGTQMALHTSVAFIVFGLAMIGVAWKRAPRGGDGLPAWSAGICVSMLPVVLVAAGTVFPQQSWSVVPWAVLIAIAIVALLALTIRRMSVAPLAHKGLLMIAMPLVLLLAFAGMVAHLKRLTEAAQQWTMQSSVVTAASEVLLGDIAEARGAARDYALTGDAGFAAAYREAAGPVSRNVEAFRTLVSDNPLQQANAERIGKLVDSIMQQLAGQVDAVRSQAPAAGRPAPAGPGIVEMNHLRNEMDAFAQEESRLGTQRRAALDAVWQRMSWLLVSGSASAIVFAAMLTLLFSSSIAGRLRRLRENAISVAAGGELAPPLPGHDEIAELDQVFHGMARSLAEAALDARARRRSESNLIDARHSEDLLKTGALQRAIFNSANFSSIATDEKGVIQIFNVGAEKMLGYAAAEVMNRITPADISDPQELVARAQALSQEAGTPITPGFEALVFKASRGIEDIYELTYIRKDGSRFPAIVSVTALRDPQASIIGYLLIGTDNTARQEVEANQALLDQRVRDQQFYTRSLIESNIDALMTTDPQGIITDVNQEMIALTGRTRDELIGAPCKNFFTDPAMAEAAIRRVLTQNKVSNYELTVRALNGKETLVSYNAATFFDRDRKLQGVFAAARDVTERKRIELALQEKNVELEHASSMKSEFLATMSHELRTPLNAIIGFSEALKDGLMGKLTPTQQEYTGDIFSSGQHLLSLINDILDLSKVEAGMMTLELDAVDLRSLLSGSLSIVKEKAAGQEVQLDLAVEGDLGTPALDARKTKQIVYNLLSNAVKFSPSGAHVVLAACIVGRGQVGRISGDWPVHGFELAASSYQRFIEIRVTDTGIGISAAGMAKLFQAFSQIDSSLSRKFEGTGLGLAMVKRLAQLHGGTSAVASREGVGACFAVWLPVMEFEGGTATLVNGTGHADSQWPRTRVQAVLVVDDDPRAVELISSYLPVPGYAVVRALGGAEALALALRLRPDLILLDLLMPGVSGLEVAQALQADATTARIPLIAITAKQVTPADRAALSAAAGRAIDVIEKTQLGTPLFMELVRRALTGTKGQGHGHNIGG